MLINIVHKHKINGGNFMKIVNELNNVKNKNGITLIALIITILFSYDEK